MPDLEFFTVIVHEGDACECNNGVTFHFDDLDEVKKFLSICFDNPESCGKYVEVVQNFVPDVRVKEEELN